MTDYGSPLFASLRSACVTEWTAYVRHEFVERLGDGSLPRDAFLHYLRQDYRFLIHFTRAWALVVVKSGRVEEMRHAAASISALIDHEMRLHVDTCAENGIDEAELAATSEAPQNLAYTRFVVDAGISGDVLDLLVALAPCVLGYGEIGARLKLEKDPATPYAAWIEAYGEDDYQAVCDRVGALLETIAARRIGSSPITSPRWPELQRTFQTACRLEAEFWRMGLTPNDDL